MNNFNYYAPTRYVFGRDMEKECGNLIRALGHSRVLVHFGSASARKSGLLDRVEESLRQAGITCFLLGGVQPNPCASLVYEGIELCKKEKVEFILAVGGGSVIDSAKAIAMGALYDGDFWDFFSDRASAKRALPVGTVLTIAAAGSEGSPDSVITQDMGPEPHLKRNTGGEFLRPVFSVVNPALTQTLPPYQTASGVADIMAHVLERYFTNTPNVQTTDRLCEALLMAVIEEAPKVMSDPNHYDARANILWAGTQAHNNLCGAGRTQDWSSHMMEHELSTLYGCSHGAGLAVIMPNWMRYVASHHEATRLATLARRVWGVGVNEDDFTAALSGIAAFRSFLRSLGLPTTMQEIGAKKENIPTLLDMLFNGRGDSMGGYMSLDRKAMEDIYLMAFED